MVGCDWSGGRWRLGACKINFCAVGCYVVGSDAGGRDGRWKGSSLGLAEKVGDIMSLAGAAGGIHCFRFVFFLGGRRSDQ